MNSEYTNMRILSSSKIINTKRKMNKMNHEDDTFFEFMNLLIDSSVKQKTWYSSSNHFTLSQTKQKQRLTNLSARYLFNSSFMPSIFRSKPFKNS